MILTKMFKSQLQNLLRVKQEDLNQDLKSFIKSQKQIAQYVRS